MTRERAQTVMIILALLVVPLLIVEHQATNPTILAMVFIANALIWLAFLAEFIWGIAAAESKWQYAKSHWFDLMIIVLSPPLYVPESLQGLRSLRALRVLQLGRMGRLLRLLRLLRAFSFLAKAWTTSGRLLGRHSFGYILVTCVLFIVGGGALFVWVEGGGLRLLDGIWWAIATLTTVGYGDVYPKSDAGRILAIFVILTGLGMMAALTANVAAHFVDSEQKDESAAVLKRLDEIAQRLDRLENKIAEIGLDNPSKTGIQS